MDQVLWVDADRRKGKIWGQSECSAVNDFHSSDFPNGEASIIPAERGWVEMDVVSPAAVNHSQSHIKKNPAFNFFEMCMVAFAPHMYAHTHVLTIHPKTTCMEMLSPFMGGNDFWQGNGDSQVPQTKMGISCCNEFDPSLNFLYSLSFCFWFDMSVCFTRFYSDHFVLNKTNLKR